MSGTPAGGRKAANTMKERYGENVFEMIGAAGGTKSRGGGFEYLAKHDPKKLRELSSKGGTISKRGKAKKEVA